MSSLLLYTTAMLKRLPIPLRIIAVVLILGVAVWALSPSFFDREVNESADEITGARTNQPADNSDQSAQPPLPSAPKDRAGTFSGLNRQKGSGTAKLIQTSEGNFIRFEEDFSVSNGPDLFVHIGDADKPNRQIAALKGNKGSQNYQLPSDVDVSSFSTIWIYCRAFSYSFAKAELAEQPQ